MKAPDGAITRDESNAINILQRVKKYHQKWVMPSYRWGDNSHSVSCTVSIRPDEWIATGDWMYHNRANYAGLATLPYDGSVYQQTPYETIDQGEYQRRYASTIWDRLDLTQIIEDDDNTTHHESVACSGGCDL